MSWFAGDPVDDDFGYAVHRAARGETGLLVKFLLGDRPLGRGERQYLADLISGNMERRKGNPNILRHDEREFRQEALHGLKAVKDTWKKEKRKPKNQWRHEDAVAEVSKRLGISYDTLDGWYRNKKRHT
jgi:hypothetical protein